MDEVARRAADGRDFEVLHQHDLPLGVASRDGNHRRPQRFRAVVSPQAAGEQTVAVSVLHDVAVRDAAGRQAAHHRVGPHVHVFLGVRHHDGLARGAAGGVQPHHLRHGAGKQTEWVRVAQIRLHGERQFDDVFQAAYVGGCQAALAQPRPEQFHVVESALDYAPEPIQLERSHLSRWQIVRCAGRVEAGWSHRSTARPYSKAPPMAAATTE